MFDDFEDFEKNHVPGPFEREEMYKMAEEKFDDVYKDNREIQDEYKRIKSSPKLAILWSILTGWKFKEDEIKTEGLPPREMLTALMLRMCPEKLVLDDSWKSNIMEALQMKTGKDAFNATADCTILIAEKDLVTDKDFQKKILSYKEKFEDSIANNGMSSYQGYIIHHLLMKKWVEDTYDETFWKDMIYKEIEKIEREPLPDKK
ncbi:MAG: hypothetical protein J6T74_03375 [Clostridia bacterium]|nr:hypothetical protein [Clostridia bacterium]